METNQGQWPPVFEQQYGPPQQNFPYGYGFQGMPPPPWCQGPFFPPPMNQWRNPGNWGPGQPSGVMQGPAPMQQNSQSLGFQGQASSGSQQSGGQPVQKSQKQGQDQSEGSRTGNQNQQMRKQKNPGKGRPVPKAQETAGNEYSDVTCYCCGEPGHHRSQCPQPPACFICKMVTHKVEDCPDRKKPRTAAKFVGSAATGLGFFQIEVPDVNDQHQGSRKNVGIVFIEAGQVTKEELSHNFSLIYKTNWPWHIRKLDEWTFLVKFPPHIPVEQVAGYPNFGLPELDGVTVNVEVWKGEMDHYAELQTVWLQLSGVAPAWAEVGCPGAICFSSGHPGGC